MPGLTCVGTSVAVTAADGVPWIVRECVEDPTLANGDGHCLIFSCDTIVRRVREFPADWRALEPSVLLELSWQR